MKFITSFFFALAGASIGLISSAQSFAPVAVEEGFCSWRPGHELTWEDTIGFGAESGWNWSRPLPVGVSHEGKSIKVGYDYGTLCHVVTDDDRVVFSYPALTVDTVNVAESKVTFVCRGRKRQFDTRAKDFISRLTGFVAPIQGFERQAYVFSVVSLDSAGEVIPYTLTRQAYIADVPTSPRLLGLMRRQANWGTHSYRDFIYRKYKEALESSDSSLTVAMNPLEIVPPMTGCNSVYCHEVLSVLGNVVSIKQTTNETYPVGGCRSSYSRYVTVDLTDGKPLAPRMMIKGINSRALKNAYLKAVTNMLLEQGYVECDDILQLKASVAKALCTGEFDIEGDGMDEINMDFSLPSSIAVIPGFLAMEVDMSLFSDFGEVMNTYVLIPSKPLERYLTPVALKISRL